MLKAVAQVPPDPRNPLLVAHSTEALLRQRVFGLCQGYEDRNDHDRLRHDPALQTALEKSRETGSRPTPCRFDKRADRQALIDIHRLLGEQLIASRTKAPKELVLDFDASEKPPARPRHPDVLDTQRSRSALAFFSLDRARGIRGH